LEQREKLLRQQQDLDRAGELALKTTFSLWRELNYSSARMNNFTYYSGNFAATFCKISRSHLHR